MVGTLQRALALKIKLGIGEDVDLESALFWRFLQAKNGLLMDSLNGAHQELVAMYYREIFGRWNT